MNSDFVGQTRSSSTSQLSPNSSFSASSPNQSASYLSPERTYNSSTFLGASGSFNASYDSESKVSWTVGGNESIDGKVKSEPSSDSVTLEAGTAYNLILSQLNNMHLEPFCEGYLHKYMSLN